MATVLPQLIATDRQTVAFFKKETTPFEEIKPAATDAIRVIGEVNPTQSRPLIENQERVNSYSSIPGVAGRSEPGTIAIPVYAKPSGVAGTAPVNGLDALFECAAGRKVIDAGVSVEYKLLRLQDIRPTATCWVSAGHTVFRLIGVVLNQIAAPLRADNSAEALSRATFSGFFAQRLITGTSELAVAVTSTADPGVTAIEVKDASVFDVGGFIEIGALTNAGAGFEITAIDYTTKILTIDPGIIDTVVAIDTLVKPWLPVPAADTTQPVHGRFGLATRGGEDLRLLSAELSYQQSLRLPFEEKNGLEFPDRILHEGSHDARVTAEMLFNPLTAKFYREALLGTQADVLVPWGTVAGSRILWTFKGAQLSNDPSLSGANEKQLSNEARAYASDLAESNDLVIKFY